MLLQLALPPIQNMLRGLWIKAQKEIAFFSVSKSVPIEMQKKNRNDLTTSCFNPLFSCCNMNKGWRLNNVCEMRSTRHCSENYNRPPPNWTRTIDIVTVFELHDPTFEVPFRHWFIETNWGFSVVYSTWFLKCALKKVHLKLLADFSIKVYS